MARPLSQKIAVLALLAGLFAGHSAGAKEEFVSYKEASAVLGSSQAVQAQPGSVLPEELRAQQEKGTVVLILDARTRIDYDREHLAGAKLPREEAYYHDLELFQQKVVRQAPSSKAALERALKDVPRATAVVTYCNNHCGLSKNLMMDLQGLGFTNVRWLEGGIDVWREKGYPVEKS